jgi:hypothetical protein
LLVWPKFEKITLRLVDLKILQRHASSLGAQLGLVTRQRRVRADAAGLGIPVLSPRAKRSGWRGPNRGRGSGRANSRIGPCAKNGSRFKSGRLRGGLILP